MFSQAIQSRICKEPVHKMGRKHNRMQEDPYRWSKADFNDAFAQKLDYERMFVTLRSCDNCCATEKEVKLLSCTGCLKGMCVPTYYCSRPCQRADWPNHKLSCGGQSDGPIPTSPIHRAQLKKSRVILERMISIQVALSWGSKMILYHIPPEQRSNVCVQFWFRNLPDPSLPWVLETIQLSTKDAISPEYRPAVEQQAGVQPVFQIFYGDTNHTPAPVIDYPPISIEECYHDHIYVPQWPWIVAQVCSMEYHGLWIATNRLRLLLGSIHSTPIECQFRVWLDKFLAPTNSATLRSGWSISKYDQWEVKMSGVLFF